MTEHTDRDLLFAAHSYKIQRDALQSQLDTSRAELAAHADGIIIPEWAVGRIRERIQQATDPTLPTDQRHSAAFALVGTIEYWIKEQESTT